MTVNGVSELGLKSGEQEIPMLPGVWLMVLLPDDAEIEPGIRVFAVKQEEPEPETIQV